MPSPVPRTRMLRCHIEDPRVATQGDMLRCQTYECYRQIVRKVNQFKSYRFHFRHREPAILSTTAGNHFGLAALERQQPSNPASSDGDIPYISMYASKPINLFANLTREQFALGMRRLEEKEKQERAERVKAAEERNALITFKIIQLGICIARARAK